VASTDGHIQHKGENIGSIVPAYTRKLFAGAYIVPPTNTWHSPFPGTLYKKPSCRNCLNAVYYLYATMFRW
jgi:hypothetical protein